MMVSPASSVERHASEWDSLSARAIARADVKSANRELDGHRQEDGQFGEAPISIAKSSE